MADYLTQAENENKTLQSSNSTAEEIKTAKDTPEVPQEDFATAVFEKISKPQFAGNLDNKDKLWDKYRDVYERDYGKQGKEVFDAAYKESAEYHKQLAMQELEDAQLPKVLSDFDWVLPTDNNTQRIDPEVTSTIALETNSGRLQMMDWWTDPTRSVREASVDSNKFINGNGEVEDVSHLKNLGAAVNRIDGTGKQIVGFEYAGASEYGRGDAKMKALYYGERPQGEMASFWDLNQSWLSNNGLTSNIAKTTVGTVLNFTMDVLDTVYTLMGAGAALVGQEDSEFYKAMTATSLGVNTMKMSKSDYDQSKIFTVNNMVDMAVNTGLQLLLAGGVTKGATALSRMITGGAKNYGKKAGLFVLGSMAAKDAHGEALKAGFTEREAAGIYFASLAAMFQANKLSNFTDDAFSAIGSRRLGNHTARSVIANLTPEAARSGNGILRAATSIANSATKQLQKLYSKPGVVGAMVSEALEEETELVAQEVINHMANVYSAIGYKGDLNKPRFKTVMDEGYWEEKGWEALLSGLGGAMGGAMAHTMRPRGNVSRNVSEDQWPVQGDTAQDMRRLAFEYARGTERGTTATERFMDTLERERNKGRFGREDYSTLWDSSEGRYRRMTELSDEERNTRMSQSDVLYNSIIAQFNHYASLFSNYAGTYEQVLEEHPEIAGVYGEEELFTTVSDLLTRKQDILANSKAGAAPGVDAQLNAILDREDAILDTVIRNTEAEVDRFIASREKESIEAEEDKSTKKKKAETLAEGQPEEITEEKEKTQQAVSSKTEKLMMDEIKKLAGALGIGGGEMATLLDTQRKLKDIEEGKFVERGIINTLLKSNHFKNVIGDNAPKKYRQYGNFVETLFKGDLSLKARLSSRKADGIRFTENLQDKLKGLPSDIEGLTEFVDSTELPFLTLEQKAEIKSKILGSVQSVEESKLNIAEQILDVVSSIANTHLGEEITIIVDEDDTSKEVTKKISAGARTTVTSLLEEHIDEDVSELPTKVKKDVARLMHSIFALQAVQAAQTTEDISRVTFDPSEVELRDEVDGYEVMVSELLEQVESGFGEEFIDVSSATQKIGIPEEMKEAQRLLSKVDKAEDPLSVKEFDGDYFSKNFTLNNQGVETLDQSLGEAIEALLESAIKDEEGNIVTFTDTEGARDIKEKIAIRKAQVQLIQRAFRIIGDVRRYNEDKFVGGFDKSVNNNTFFSDYVQDMVGDPKRYFDLLSKKRDNTATEEENEEFLKMLSIIGTPDGEVKSQLDAVVDHLDALDKAADELMSMASQSSEQLRQNYYVSTINYLKSIMSSFSYALDMDDFEGSDEAAALFNQITEADINANITATEEGAITALQSITTIKRALYELGKLTLPSGKTGIDIIKRGGFEPKYMDTYVSMFYSPDKFLGNLQEVLEMVGSGKEPKDMKLPTIDQLVVAEQLAANSTTSLNKLLRDKGFKDLAGIDVNVTTIEGLQGTGKTEVVAGMAASIIQKSLAQTYKDNVTDHRTLMCGNTDKQCAKLHDAAKRNGVHIGSIDGNKSLNQFDLYNLLVNRAEGESDEAHLKRIAAKFKGIDLIVYDEASYIEFLEKFPDSHKDLKEVGTLNAILYQLSRINKIRPDGTPKISLVLMGDKTQGGFMEGMRSPRNPDAEFKITGKGTQGAIGSGRIPKTNKLEKTFRFEVPSLKRDIDAFKEISSASKLGASSGKLTNVSTKRRVETSWNVISNDANGKLGGVKFSKTWTELCNDEETIENIKKQLDADPEFDVIIITNDGIDSIPEGSKLRDLVNQYEGSKRIEVATMYTAQGSEASYSLVNVPNNMLVSVDTNGALEAGEVNIVSMAMGRAKFFTQVAASGNGADLVSSNEAEITKQSEPEVSSFRESWHKVLNEGLFNAGLNIPEESIVIEEDEVAQTETDPTVILDINDPNVESPAEQDVRRQELLSELGIPKGNESDITNKKQELSEQLDDENLSDNRRNEIESTINLLNNLDDVQADNDTADPIVEDSLNTEDYFTNRREDDKLRTAEELGTIVGYSGRNLAAGAIPSSMGLDYQTRDTNRVFGSNMSTEVVNQHKLSAIGHDGQGGSKMGDYEYKLITYQFMIDNKIATNTGLFAKPKNSPGDWFMCLSFPKADTYEGEFGQWLQEQGDTLNEARTAWITNGTDITAEDYVTRIGLGNKAEIIEQKGSDAKNKLYAISRNVADGAIKQLIRGTTAGALETGPLYLDRLARSNSKIIDIALKIQGKTGLNILELPVNSSFRSKISDQKLIDSLGRAVVNPAIDTEATLKMNRFGEFESGKKVGMLDINGEEIPIVQVKSTRGVIPYAKRADIWYPILAVSETGIILNEDVHDENSSTYDAEISQVANLLTQSLVDDKAISDSSIGVGHDNMNDLIASHLRYDKRLLGTNRGTEDLTKAILNQFYKNLPKSLGNAQLPIREAMELIKETSGSVTFSKPLVVRSGKKAGHSVLFYSTRGDIDLGKMSSEELQGVYKNIAANRTPDENDVDQLLGLNRDGIGVIWLNQKGYTLSELNDIVENTNTTLSKKLYQLSTWGNANERLVGMFAAIAKVSNIYDSTDRLESLLDHLGESVPESEVETWVEKYKDTEAFNKLQSLLTYIFKPESLGRISTAFTTNPRMDDLLGVKDDAHSRGLSSEEIIKELQDYMSANPETEAALNEYGLTIEDLAQIDLASKNSLNKGELVRNKKTGKPVVNYDVIRYVPSSIIGSLTGTTENIDPEINLVNLFQRLNMEEYSDSKSDILAMLDDLLPNVPGLGDNIYASPFISLNSKSTLEVGLSPDEGNLMDDLTTSVKMVANPGVAMNTSSITKGFVFENLREKKTDRKAYNLRDFELKFNDEFKVLYEGLRNGTTTYVDDVKKQLKNIIDGFNVDEDDKVNLNGRLNRAYQIIDNTASQMNLKDETVPVIDPIKTNLMEHFGVTEETNPELYSALNSLDFIRANLVFNNEAREAYIQTIEDMDLSKYFDHPSKAIDYVDKKSRLVEAFKLSEPMVPLTDTGINIKIASLDLDNPVPIDKNYLNILNPADDSFTAWREFKTSRPSIPHLYAMLTDGGVDATDKAVIAEVLRKGIGGKGRKLRRRVIDMVETGNFSTVEYEQALAELAELEGTEAAEAFANSELVLQAFNVDAIMRMSDNNTKLDLLKRKMDELLTLPEADRVEGLTQLRTALSLLFKNQENLSKDQNLLLESVQNSLNSSIISEKHQSGELTTSQLMMETFKKTGMYGKLSDEALSIFSDMEKIADKVPGLNIIHEYVQNPQTIGQQEYNKAVSAFKGYLRTKTENRSVIKEFNKLISDSFCV